jgi:hypothetical protein
MVLFCVFSLVILFPHSHDCNSYPVAVGFPTVAVLFLQTPSHGRWPILIAFSLKYPKIQSWGGPNINMFPYGCGSIQVMYRRYVKMMYASSLVLLLGCLDLK